ncbi:MAG: CARDB domain-containing protein [Candidatus Aenigmatarchaeota archaeon]
MMLLFMAVLFAHPVNAESGALIDIALNTQNPYPVQPGQIVDIEISVQNTYYIRSETVVVEILPKAPFTLLPGQDTKKTFTGIEGLGSRSASYKLSVNMDTVTNNYEMEFRVYVDSSTDPSLEKIQINVQGVPDLVIESITTEPKNIEPGSQVELLTTIKNVGTGTAHDLRLVMSSPNEVILPLLAGGSVYLGELQPGQSKVADMLLSVDSTAEEQTYTLTLTSNFNDESNTATSKNFSVGLPVRGNILMDIIDMEANYARGVVKIEIANKGTADASSLESRLVVGNKTIGVYYVSQLKATKKTTLEFPLVLQGTGTLQMSYTGPGIEKNTLEKEVVFNFQQPSSGDGFTTAIYIVIIAVVAYLAYRKFFRKKKGH